MIRYKKRTFQQGGTSPASDYAQGAAAVASTFTQSQNPYKRIEMQPDPAAGKRGGGSKVGGGQFNNIMSMKPLTSVYLPNLAKKKETELSGRKERFMHLYAQNKQYFETANGLKELNAYKNKLYEYQNELKTLDMSYKNALTRSKGATDRYAFTSDNEVFVKDEKNQLKVMDYDAMVKYRESNKSSLQDNQYTALTVGSLLASMDDTSQYGGESVLDSNVLLDALNSVVDEKAVTTTFYNRVKSLYKDAVKGENFVGADGEVILTKEEIKNFTENGIESKKMTSFINNHLTDRATNAYFRNYIYSSEGIEAAILSGGSVAKSIRKEVYNRIMDNVIGDAVPNPDADKAKIKSTNDMRKLAGANRYNIAETNFDNNAEEVGLDIAFDRYEDGVKVNPKGTELVLGVRMHEVANSGEDLYDLDHARILEDERTVPEKVTLSQFKKLGQVAKIADAVMIDGTPVDKVLFGDRKGFIPVMHEDMAVVNMVVDRNGKVATWAIPIIDSLNDVADAAYTKAKSDMEKESSRLKIEKDAETIEAELQARVDSIVQKELNVKLEEEGKGAMSLEDFYTNFQYKNFYKVSVVGNIDPDEAFGMDGKAMEYTTETLSDNAKATAKEYNMDTWGFDTIVMTSILVPAWGVQGKEGTEKIDYGTAATDISNLLHSNAGIDIRNLFKTGTNSALESLIIKKASN